MKPCAQALHISAATATRRLQQAQAKLRKLLSGHLCRCTGYENIMRAVKKTMYKRLSKEMPQQ